MAAFPVRTFRPMWIEATSLPFGAQGRSMSKGLTATRTTENLGICRKLRVMGERKPIHSLGKYQNDKSSQLQTLAKSSETTSKHRDTCLRVGNPSGRLVGLT